MSVTWEELLDTTNYIVEQEKNANNTIKGLCGLFGSNDK